jgi:hypothetical protein
MFSVQLSSSYRYTCLIVEVLFQRTDADGLPSGGKAERSGDAGSVLPWCGCLFLTLCYASYRRLACQVTAPIMHSSQPQFRLLAATFELSASPCFDSMSISKWTASESFEKLARLLINTHFINPRPWSCNILREQQVLAISPSPNTDRAWTSPVTSYR